MVCTVCVFVLCVSVCQELSVTVCPVLPHIIINTIIFSINLQYAKMVRHRWKNTQKLAHRHICTHKKIRAHTLTPFPSLFLIGKFHSGTEIYGDNSRFK